MAEYLSKETLQEKLNRKKAGPATKRYTEGWNDAILMVKSMIHSEKAADVATVRHGYWRPILHKDGKTDYECSCCLGIIMDVPDDDEHDLCAWCSMCGAKMDLK